MVMTENPSESSAAGTSAPALVLDLKGLVCPVPAVKVANAIKGFQPGVPFEVCSFLEVLDELVANGHLRLDPRANPEPVTYHDSCNIGRKAGMFEEPRRILDAAVADFRDMASNRGESFCCGAGSGLVAVEEWRKTRLTAGLPKAEQIRATEAKVVVTSCDNCRHQIGDLSEHYRLDVEVRNLAEVTARALA